MLGYLSHSLDAPYCVVYIRLYQQDLQWVTQAHPPFFNIREETEMHVLGG